jgi:hypothetical protein
MLINSTKKKPPKLQLTAKPVETNGKVNYLPLADSPKLLPC